MSKRDADDCLTDYFSELLGSDTENSEAAGQEKEHKQELEQEQEQQNTTSPNKSEAAKVPSDPPAKVPPVSGSDIPTGRSSISNTLSVTSTDDTAATLSEPRSIDHFKDSTIALERKPSTSPSSHVLEEDTRVLLELKQKEKLQALLNQGLKLEAPVSTKQPTQTELSTKTAPKTLTKQRADTTQKQITPVKVDVSTVPKVKTQVDTEVEVKVELKVEPKVQAKTSTDVLTKVDTAEQVSVAHSIHRLLDWADNGRPIWAQERFDVLLFGVSGLTLAVPLVALGQIQPIGEGLTPIFGQSKWFMGLLPTNAGKIKTINTALFVMPEKYSDTFLETAKYVISIDGLSWGLAVDSVNQPVSLSPDEVKWRGERSKRPWLAGTVKSSMCALIDIPQMAKLLMESDKSTASTKR